MKLASAIALLPRLTPAIPHQLVARYSNRQIASFAGLQKFENNHAARKSVQFEAEHARMATEPAFVASVHRDLAQHGMAKIKLGLTDPSSTFLKDLVCSFNKYHGHQLPISHSASQGWFWDVRPNDGTQIPLQTANHRARSETMADFPWHTDCSYEDSPPRYFGLHVLQHDRFGGGTLSAMNIDKLGQALSPEARRSLCRKEFGITIPPEFVKDKARSQIIGNIMATGEAERAETTIMRFRRDITKPLTAAAASALRELDLLLDSSGRYGSPAETSTIHLKAEDFPTGTIILMDNRRWLHARNHIRDPERHLRRIRWDAVPFPRD